MNRRHFLRMAGASTLGPAWPALASGQTAGAATVLFDDRSVPLTKAVHQTTTAGEALWILKKDLPRVNGFELKPQGACRADICIPVPKDMAEGDRFNLTAFARRVGQSVVADAEARVWSFGEMPVLRGDFLSSRIAPDFEVPDRQGRPVRLSRFRGKKLLVVTWASW